MTTTRSQSASQNPPDAKRRKRVAPPDGKRRKRKPAVEMGKRAGRRSVDKKGANEEDDVSSAPSSPLCEPLAPNDADSSDSAVIKAYEIATKKFDEKQARHSEMVTRICRPLPKAQVQITSITHEDASRTLLSSAKFVIALSSFDGDKLLKRCSGFWINWDEKKNTGTLLTTAHLLCLKPRNDLSRRGKYFFDAKVIVHLLDGSTADGCLIYLQEHYDLAFFSVRMDSPVHVSYFYGGVKTGQELFKLGRDENFDLRVIHGRAEYSNPDPFERHHYVYFETSHHHIEYNDGGPVIDLDGKVVGIVDSYFRGSFIPSSILLKCFELWKEFEIIPRPHLGLMVFAIKHLDPLHVDRIWRKYKIDDGLIVEEVSGGSEAERVGIRIGDIIESVNGQHISNTIELENVLLSLCKGPFNKASDVAAKVPVSVGIFHVRTSRRKIRHFTIDVSDLGEVIESGSYIINLDEGCSGK